MTAVKDRTSPIARRRLVLCGQVQGVGFRPFVYRLAGELGLAGFVRNDGAGVTIEAQGPAGTLDRFAGRLRVELPPLARIDRLEQDELAVVPADGAVGRFEIFSSDRPGESGLQADIAPDVAVCDDCLAELFDPTDRRFGYPFINCTNCGPRYSIVRDVPYDRALTTMSVFTMCARCRAEYDDPADRRFHAQPNGCPRCGPRIWLEETVSGVVFSGPKTGQKTEFDPLEEAGRPRISSRSRTERERTARVIEAAARALLAGRIVAIRGLGGFHLAVRADDAAAVQRLRDRKGREHKPLAVMVRDLAAAGRVVRLDAAAAELLVSPQRPIVIATRQADAAVAPSVAPASTTLGVMLPYTPLHHLLFAEIERQRFGRSAPIAACAEAERAVSIRKPKSEVRNFPPLALVMTSGNIADEPIVASNDEALAGLADVADLFLLHDREIHRRIDDSVVQAGEPGASELLPTLSFREGAKAGSNRRTTHVRPGGFGGGFLPLRRARGYVPVGIDLPAELAAVEHGLAVGGELKNTVALVRRRGSVAQAVLSEHVGDLKDSRVYRRFRQVIAHLAQVTHTRPAWIAHDLHPMYLSTQWAKAAGREEAKQTDAATRGRGDAGNGWLARSAITAGGGGGEGDGAADKRGLRLIGVQHHHAHVAACLAEHGRTGPAIGIAADGVGFGDDGAIWGGEILIADLTEFRRVGRVRPIGLPGGDAAAIRTARPAVAWLFDATGGRIPDAWVARLLPDPIERDIVLRMLADKINCPASSALGRFFDAAAAMTGLARTNRFEAEAPMALEAASAPDCRDEFPFEISDFGFWILDSKTTSGAPPGPPPPSNPKSRIQNPKFEIDLRPTALALMARIDAGESAGRVAAMFHNTLAAALEAAAERTAELTGLRCVALSGGVFCNRRLTEGLSDRLAARGLEVLTHRQVPANDGGLALGQAAVAAARTGGWTSEIEELAPK